jgi:hypothetical protein
MLFGSSSEGLKQWIFEHVFLIKMSPLIMWINFTIRYSPSLVLVFCAKNKEV